MLPLRADVPTVIKHISAVYITYIKLQLHHAFLPSIDRNETSDSYVDFNLRFSISLSFMFMLLY